MPEQWPEKPLIILGASEEQIPLYQEARLRGVPTVGVDMRQDAPAFPFADTALTVSTRDAKAVADALSGVRPAGVVCGASDAALASWRALGLRYGTPYVYPERALIAGDKATFRALAASWGIFGPDWITSDSTEGVVAKSARLRFPLMVKPVDGSGSKGVTRVDHPVDLRTAAIRAQLHSASRRVIAEEFIEGRPLAVEIFMQGGNVKLACMKDKEFVGHSFVVRRLCTAQVPPMLNCRIVATVGHLCRKLGITDGPANFDIVLAEGDQVCVVEANARLGGDGVPRLLAAAYGVNVVGALVALALGEPFEEHLRSTRDGHAAVELIGSPLDTDGELLRWEGVAEARSVPGVTDVELYSGPGDLVHPHTQSGHKIGRLIAAGASAAAAISALEKACSLLRPVIRPMERT